MEEGTGRTAEQGKQATQVEDGKPARHERAGKPAKQAQSSKPADHAPGRKPSRQTQVNKPDEKDEVGEPANGGEPVARSEPTAQARPAAQAESIEEAEAGNTAEQAALVERIEVRDPAEQAESIEQGEIRDPAERDEVDKLAEQWARSGMPAAAIARLELSKRVSRLALRHEQAMKTALADLNLTYAEFDVLAALRRAPGPLRPSELTRSLFLTSGGTSNVLQRLAAAGYVERESNAADARSRWVRLTPSGESIIDKALITSTRVHEDLLAGIPDTTVRAAADALREITRVTDRRH